MAEAREFFRGPDGFSGAQVREVAFLALQRAVLRDVCNEGPLRLKDDDLTHAIARLRADRANVIGFSTQRNANPKP